ncbi:hypothetical protein IV203_036933 [Nitzschia inconspicua]|uniref:GAG-pre-integrase domain-containing protein n=1 Tax=Nitzschia inconspicua TaxID=303405 RepID=A0A9K3LGW2_9STRA|nr:hypothetical protein IV203_036933 [Nitzschia inconspicua]
MNHTNADDLHGPSVLISGVDTDSDDEFEDASALDGLRPMVSNLQAVLEAATISDLQAALEAASLTAPSAPSDLLAPTPATIVTTAEFDVGAPLRVRSVPIAAPPKSGYVQITSAARLQQTGLGSSSVVEGVGTVEWQVRDFLGNVRTIRTKAYLVRTAPVRLLSPQTYFKEGLRGRLTVTHDRTELTLHDGSVLSLPFADNHLPYLFPEWQPVVGLTRDDASLLGSAPTVALSVADETNQNLTSSQKELLLWHWRLGHSHFSWVQRLASAPRTDRRHILTTKTTCSTASPPCCAACSLAKLKRRTPPGPVGGIAPPAMQIRSDDLHPGDCISVDQYVSSVPGRLPHTAGKESSKDKYHGGTIFVDHATSFLFLVNQVSLSAGETIHSKVAFERFAHSCGH